MVRFSLRKKIVSGKHFPDAVCFCQSGGDSAPEPPLVAVQSGEAKIVGRGYENVVIPKQIRIICKYV
jgi:hypothetical protein